MVEMDEMLVQNTRFMELCTSEQAKLIAKSASYEDVSSSTISDLANLEIQNSGNIKALHARLVNLERVSNTKKL